MAVSLPKFLGCVSWNGVHWLIFNIYYYNNSLWGINLNGDVNKNINYKTEKLELVDPNIYKTPHNTEELINLIAPVPNEDGWYEDKDGVHWLKRGDCWHWKNIGSKIDRSDNKAMYNFSPFRKIKKPVSQSLLEFEQYIFNLDDYDKINCNTNLLTKIQREFNKIFYESN